MNSKELTVRGTILAVLTGVFLSGSLRSVEAQQGLPTVTIMQAGTGEFERDLEAIMKLAGKKGEEQWPVIQAILPAFTQGIDPDRPIRVDILFGKERDYRLSIPFDKEKDFLSNVTGFIGAKPRRVGSGLYLLKAPAFNGYLRILKSKYALIAADRNNIPPTFNPLPDIQPLVDAGYDMAASVTNTADGADDRRKAIDELRKELLDTLKKTEDESDEEFEIRRVGLIHQLKELERLFADSESLVLGWTTDGPKKEGRLALELTALKGTELEKSIIELGAKPSLFSSVSKSDNAIFFGRINHSLDEMRKTHIDEMLELLSAHCVSRIDASDKVAADGKSAAKEAAEKFYAMLGAGNKMGVIDGFVDIAKGDDGRSVVGAIRADDGTAINGVLESLKAAGWEVELAEASGESGNETSDSDESDAADSGDAKDAEAGDAESEAEAESETEEEKSEEEKAESAGEAEDAEPEAAEEAGKDDAGEDVALAIHKVKVPESDESDFAHLFGKDATLLVAATADAVYYAAGAGAEDRLREAIEATGEDESKNDGTFIETWTKLGSWIEYLKGRRERREEGQDLSKLTEEEKKAREERIELRDMAINAFEAGHDTIHTTMKSDQKKVTGMTTFAEGILRFVGTAVADFAATKLQ